MAKVLIAEPLAEAGVELLRAHHEVDARHATTREELLAAVGGGGAAGGGAGPPPPAPGGGGGPPRPPPPRRRIVYAWVADDVAHDNTSMQVFAESGDRCRLVWIHDSLPDRLTGWLATTMDRMSPVLQQTLKAA